MIDDYPQAMRECQGTIESCHHKIQLDDALMAAGMCQGEGEEGDRRFIWKPKNQEGACAME